MNSYVAPLPAWIEEILADTARPHPAEALELSVRIAIESARNGGGPFGALLVNQTGDIVSAGWNSVVHSQDSTAHAEIDCLRRAQAQLQTHDLQSKGEFTLYSSTAPCIQCFGAIWWSGLSNVIVGASKTNAEETGFNEGPVSPMLWEAAKLEKNISYSPLVVDGLDLTEPFKEFKRLGGILY